MEGVVERVKTLTIIMEQVALVLHPSRIYTIVSTERLHSNMDSPHPMPS